MSDDRSTVEAPTPRPLAPPAVHPPRHQIYNLPNALTTARLVLSAALFVLISLEQWFACLVVFAVAAFTDWLDGYVARLQGLNSALGRTYDPLVDKVMICGAYIFLLPQGTKEGWLTPWMVTVVVGRELIITGLRGFMENRGAKFGADWLGKIKMGLQCAVLIALFIILAIYARYNYTAMMDGTPLPPNWLTESPIVYALLVIRDGLIWTMLTATAFSGLQYIWRALTLLSADSD